LPTADERVGRLTDEDARRILMRASELDAKRSTTVTPEELREIAGEAGISSESFLAALRDVSRGQVSEPRENPFSGTGPFYKRFFGSRARNSEAGPRPSMVRSIVAVGAGLLLGVTGSLLGPGAFAGAIAMVIGSVHLASYHRHRGSHEAFQLEMVSLWLSFMASFTLASRDDAAILFVVLWLVLSAVGGITIVMGGGRTQRDDEETE
jgi:hypothetical protein